jgi:hypothetical protein
MAKAKDKKKVKRIVKAKIDFISLCEKGANTFSTIYKGGDEDKSVDLSTICKDMNELGEIVALVYAPESVDSQGDVASAAVIKEFAHDFSKNGEGIDVKHNEEVLSKDAVYVAESFIVQKNDPRFDGMKDYDGNSVDATGGWGVVLKVDDEDLREKYRSGEWEGVSMGGTAIKKTDVSSASMMEKFFDYILKFNKENKTLKTEDKDMALTLSKEDLKAVVDGVAEQMTKSSEAAAEKLAKSAEAEAEAVAKAKAEKIGKTDLPKPMIKVNATDEEADRYKRDTAIYELSKTVDSEDGNAVLEFRKEASNIALVKDIDEYLKVKKGASYDSFYVSNQTPQAGVISKSTGNTTADLIVKQMEEEDAAAAAEAKK